LSLSLLFFLFSLFFLLFYWTIFESVNLSLSPLSYSFLSFFSVWVSDLRSGAFCFRSADVFSLELETALNEKQRRKIILTCLDIFERFCKSGFVNSSTSFNQNDIRTTSFLEMTWDIFFYKSKRVRTRDYFCFKGLSTKLTSMVLASYNAKVWFFGEN